MNRFFKKNMFLVGFLGIAALGILVLLVVAVMQDAKMREYIRKTNEMRKDRDALVRQKPPAVRENIALIQDDIDGYGKAVVDLRQFFGQPLRPALDVFADRLEVKTDRLLQLFRTFWEKEKQTQSSRELTYRRFRADCGRVGGGEALWTVDRWDDAMQAFEEKAQTVMLEKIDDKNREEIFLSALGLPRNQGNQPQRLDVFTRDLRARMVDFLNEKKVELVGVYFNSVGISKLKTDADFDDMGSRRRTASASESVSGRRGERGEGGGFSGKDASAVISNWTIMSDLVRRVGESGVNALEQLSYESLAGRKDGDMTIYRYEFVVRGTPKSIRELLNNLLDAYQENRVYITRNVTIRKLEDQAQDIIDVAQGVLGAPKAESEGALALNTDEGEATGRGRGGDRRAAGPGYFKESGQYGEIVTGRSDLCEAVVVVDYVIYSAQELQ